jgi:cytochrome c biogenesis DsbD-like protein
VTFRRLKIRRLRDVSRNGTPLNALVLISALLLLSVSCLAQSQIPSPRDVVSPAVYVSADPAARGVPFQVAVVFKIRPGFHVNAREKSADYLIATDLRAETPAGFKAGDVAYPKGQLHTFTFSKTPLNVYQGTVTLRMPVTAQARAPVGSQQIPLKLRYQACSTEVCLPPVTIDLQAAINIVASPATAKPAHAELFPAP